MNELGYAVKGGRVLKEIQSPLKKMILEIIDTYSPHHNLAIYGSLAPGMVNHYIVSELPGKWLTGKVRGNLIQKGWGASIGFPGLEWIPTQPENPVNVHILNSISLPKMFKELDEFEGGEYIRILVPVEMNDQTLQVANIYTSKPSHNK